MSKSRGFLAIDVARLKHGHAATLALALAAADVALTLQRRLSALVNDTYGLTRKVQLPWDIVPAHAFHSFAIALYGAPQSSPLGRSRTV